MCNRASGKRRRAAKGAVGSEAALLDVGQVAAILNCSRRHVFRLTQVGRMPRPLKLGSLLRWNRQAVQEWIDRGCPHGE